MRGIVFNVFMIVLSVMGMAQEIEGWKNYATGKFAKEEVRNEQVFLIESSLEALRNSLDTYQILRTIDANHHVVKAKLNGNRDGIWRVNNEWKLNLHQDASKGLFYITVTDKFDGSSLSSFNILKQYSSINTFLISGSFRDIESTLLNDHDVIHVTNKVSKPFVESRVIDLNLNPNRVNKVHHFFPTLNGGSETVSIQENMFDVEDIDLLNRSLQSGLESEEVDNHATEMATIIAGAGNSFVTGRGVAKKATIISSSFSDAMPDSNEDYIEFSVNTQNHSYGIIRASEYGIEARAFDVSADQNRNLLHIFSSGNEGLEISRDGIYEGLEGFANLTGNIKMSKNSLVVGSVDTIGNAPDFVSRGPAYDGRVKPEVVAYSVVGSSNSAALVSGIATLLQQQYREANITDMPSALVKALIINGSEDVGSEGLDFVTGYGNVNAWASLNTLVSNQTYSGSVANGSMDSFDLNIPTDAINLKVTICWTDPAANANDFPALINNLDLRLNDGATTILPWVLDSNPSIAELGKMAIRAVDDLNNVEQITIDNPEENYTVEIVGSSVAGTQDFYVVWQYEFADSFEWDFPTGSDNMPYNGETGSYFRWTTTKSSTGTLSYTTDDVNWLVLDNNVQLEYQYWRWNSPPSIEGEVRARIEADGEMFETELFSVSVPLKPGVGFNCADSLLLKWNSSPNAVDYTVYNLGSEKLEEYTTVSDTFLVVANTENFPNRFFSIQPNLASDKSLLPSPTFDYALQGIECYIFSFFQTVALDTGIYLNLSLGTTYGIDQITFERNDISTFETIETLTELNQDSYSFLDAAPNQGYNEHRVTIYFVNGEELTLSAGTSFYLTEESLRVFPNPIQAGEPFSIITRQFEETSPLLELIDDRGAVVHQQKVQGMQDVIPTVRLRSGIYYYRLHADGDLYTGRLLIR